ncbi:hypothetical protein BDF20DRAFT_894871 [Mycotypha africana]|uniref:uncharacterized protein n=1 Tax=Mycotypha africana TaxID=64632 RepID=UPI0023000227|nr:uncharacterized protein BDF20DRAFT_894871 [Mycotypha africana]KAI8968183.1 hypothetical protein BDF20DRAFT_894871 [Mycotypha africana]
MSKAEKAPSVKSSKTFTSRINKVDDVKLKKGIKKDMAGQKTEGLEEKKLTQGQKLLKAMTAQKAAKQALMKGVEKTHVTFDEEGNEANVEKVVQKSLKKPTNTASKNDKSATDKKATPTKKRKAEAMKDAVQEKTGDENDDELKKKQPKKPKKSKKEKKEQKQAEETEKKESKQEEALAYVRLFVQNRASWKFKKMLQIWLLQHLYTIPESEFDNVLIYLKDIQGSARENTKKEAEGIISATLKDENPTTASQNNGYDDNDDDDFDAEKLLAAVGGSGGHQAQPQQQQLYEVNEDDSDKIKRAKLIFKSLS